MLILEFKPSVRIHRISWTNITGVVNRKPRISIHFFFQVPLNKLNQFVVVGLFLYRECVFFLNFTGHFLWIEVIDQFSIHRSAKISKGEYVLNFEFSKNPSTAKYHNSTKYRAFGGKTLNANTVCKSTIYFLPHYDDWKCEVFFFLSSFELIEFFVVVGLYGQIVANTQPNKKIQAQNANWKSYVFHLLFSVLHILT